MANGGAGQKKSMTVAAMIVGIVLGVTIAAIVAWYMTQKNPATFKEPPVAREAARPLPPPVANLPAPRAPVVNQPQDFEFYRVLPDKAENQSKKSPLPAPKPSVAPSVKPGDATPYIVQAGSFQSAADAEKLKARLALAGLEASVQSVDLPGKGIWHRVRLGPFAGLTAANEAIANLKSNGVANAAAIHAQ
ncbi:hypothetical protein UT4_06690 [Ferrigenium sp. UT4]